MKASKKGKLHWEAAFERASQSFLKDSLERQTVICECRPSSRILSVRERISVDVRRRRKSLLIGIDYICARFIRILDPVASDVPPGAENGLTYLRIIRSIQGLTFISVLSGCETKAAMKQEAPRLCLYAPWFLRLLSPSRIYDFRYRARPIRGSMGWCAFQPHEDSVIISALFRANTCWDGAVYLQQLEQIRDIECTCFYLKRFFNGLPAGPVRWVWPTCDLSQSTIYGMITEWIQVLDFGFWCFVVSLFLTWCGISIRFWTQFQLN